ncbi:cellulose binding domain-containing protein [Micromonospora soli]|uniref:cellulose binding domain-containing protein n=1 Tax=Micromonospora sp. NBRC 110009 TaxID=3061627 RepID=UPI0026734A8A|nr:cellulose binding domain-containing protein [Micromonospora sp. NBRC 110009]WKT96711.1 cellulose binding domain-containing protein [Micromonospora sp. NBRC 110009]
MSGTRRTRLSPAAAIASSPWVLVAIGAIVMVVLLVVALGATRDRRTYADLPPPAAPVSLPDLPAVTASRAPTSADVPVLPGLSPRSTVLSGAPAPSPPVTAGARSGRPAPPPPAPAAPPPASVTGRYAVVTRFQTGFVGEVLIVNADSTVRGWTVRLTFSGGQVADTWVVDAEQGRASGSGGDLTYRSGVDLAPGASARLRFRVEPAATTTPDACTVNGARCAGF